MEVLGAVAGAVGTLLITSNLSQSPWANLLAAAAGAAIGPIASYRSPRRRLPLGLCVVAIGIGLAVTYTSVAVVDVARDTTTLPPVTGSPTEAPTAVPTEDASPEAVPIRVETSPAALHCTATGCDSAVAVKSVGGPGLEISGINVEGDAPTLFDESDDCTDGAIDACEVGVEFTPPAEPGTVSAQLVIHHNGEGSPVIVPLEGVALPDLSTAAAECRHEGGPIDVSLTVAASASVAEVPLRFGLADGTVQDESIVPGQPVVVSIQPTLQPSDATIVTIAIDPDDAIEEADEENNTREVPCTLVRDHR